MTLQHRLRKWKRVPNHRLPYRGSLNN